MKNVNFLFVQRFIERMTASGPMSYVIDFLLVVVFFKMYLIKMKLGGLKGSGFTKHSNFRDQYSFIYCNFKKSLHHFS